VPVNISAEVVSQQVTDVGSVLQGRVSGVSVDAQGGPGEVAVVRIRVLAPTEITIRLCDRRRAKRGGNNLLNNGDIETITILKDPSITLYTEHKVGNGVIVITTKSGKNWCPKLEYNVTAPGKSPTTYPKS